MAFDRREIQTILAVHRCGTIRAASDHLGVAPSVVSRQIAETESRLGVRLFERSPKGMHLTEPGVLVLEHLRGLTEEYGLLRERLMGLRGQQQRHIRIHCGEGFLADFIQNGLARVLARHPHVYYDLRIGSTGAVMEALVNGDTDIGIAYTPPETSAIRSIIAARQPLCVIAPPGHPLAARDRIALTDCVGFPLALLSRGHGASDLLMRVAADYGIALSPRLSTSSIDALRRFVISGLGLTFLPRASVSMELAHGLVVARDLDDLPLSHAAAHLMVRARRRLPETVERFVEHLANHMASFEETALR